MATGRNMVEIKFSGGLEQLSKDLKIDISGDLQTLIKEVRSSYIKSDVFASQFGILTPGILVLINDTDWELEDTYRYKLQNNDEIVFISTLHGG